MPKTCYVAKKLRDSTLIVTQQAEEILEEYRQRGFTLTLRQLYYQFVARGLLENTERNYKRLGDIVNKARLAGLIDWNMLVDRTRSVRSLAHWGSVAQIVRSCADQYRVDMWENQPNYVEVWIEKDALVGVISDVCSDLDVPFLSCRGYTSQSEMWQAGQRIADEICYRGKNAVILHFGDHDPSGIDMSRDIEDRLRLFIDHRVNEYISGQSHAGPLLDFRRLALTWDQIEEYTPPPNPAKESDSRHAAYVKLYGHESWELDALPPEKLIELIRDEVQSFVNDDIWEDDKGRERDGRARLGTLADNEEDKDDE